MKFINKLKKLGIALSIGAVSMATWSCESYVEGHETSPNSPTDAPADLMVQGTQLSLNVALQGEGARLAGIWSGYFTGADRQYISYEDYAMTSGDFNGMWGEAYSGTFKNARVMQEKYDAVNNKLGKGMAQVLEAMAVGAITDLFGDVPYSEAVDVANFPNPKYDSQASVYTALQATLSDAITNLESGSGAINNDLYYGGSAASWAALAHSLKARFYLNTGEYASAVTEAAMGITTPAGDFMGNTASSFAFTVRDWNLYFQFTWWDREGYMTAEKAYLPTLLDGSNANTRENAKTFEAARYSHFYLVPGDYSALDPNYYGFFWPTQGNAMFSSVETHLIAAEAEARLGNNDNALTHLNAARADNDAYMANVVGAGSGWYTDYAITDFDAGGIANTGTQTQAAALLAEILEEAYISYYGSLQGFSLIRRTDNSLAIPSRSANNPIPERFLYPQSEINSNSSFPGVQDMYTATPVNQ